jgi:cbb3-type cytochrome oxidase subunit 3
MSRPPFTAWSPRFFSSSSWAARRLPNSQGKRDERPYHHYPFRDASSAASSSSGSSTPFTAEDFINKLFPNGWSFLINFLAMIVLFIAVYFIAYKPVKKYVEARKDYVEHNLRDSERAKAINEAKAAEGDKSSLMRRRRQPRSF